MFIIIRKKRREREVGFKNFFVFTTLYWAKKVGMSLENLLQQRKAEGHQVKQEMKYKKEQSEMTWERGKTPLVVVERGLNE